MVKVILDLSSIPRTFLDHFIIHNFLRVMICSNLFLDLIHYHLFCLFAQFLNDARGETLSAIMGSMVTQYLNHIRCLTPLCSYGEQKQGTVTQYLNDTRCETFSERGKLKLFVTGIVQILSEHPKFCTPFLQREFRETSKINSILTDVIKMLTLAVKAFACN